LRRVDRLFLISDDGKTYICKQFPWFASHCEVARLGVKPAGFVTSPSRDRIRRIASCSLMVPVKRLDLLLAAIERLALSTPSQTYEWHHLGDGPCRSDVERLAEQMPGNVKCRVWGYLSNEEVMGC